MTQDEIKAKVANEARWCERAILAIYARQTADEQESYTTTHHNGVGFSACDAEIMTSFALQLRKGRRLSAKQLTIAQKRMPHYARQLNEIAAQGAH